MLVCLGAFLAIDFTFYALREGLKEKEQEEVLFTHKRPHAARTYSHINFRKETREIFQSPNEANL